jgi:hypothetical protein
MAHINKSQLKLFYFKRAGNRTNVTMLAKKAFTFAAEARIFLPQLVLAIFP